MKFGTAFLAVFLANCIAWAEDDDVLTLSQYQEEYLIDGESMTVIEITGFPDSWKPDTIAIQFRSDDDNEMDGTLCTRYGCFYITGQSRTIYIPYPGEQVQAVYSSQDSTFVSYWVDNSRRRTDADWNDDDTQTDSERLTLPCENCTEISKDSSTALTVNGSQNLNLTGFPSDWSPTVLAVQVNSSDGEELEGLLCAGSSCYELGGWTKTVYLTMPDTQNLCAAVFVSASRDYEIHYWVDNSGVVTDPAEFTDENADGVPDVLEELDIDPSDVFSAGSPVTAIPFDLGSSGGLITYDFSDYPEFGENKKVTFRFKSQQFVSGFAPLMRLSDTHEQESLLLSLGDERISPFYNITASLTPGEKVLFPFPIPESNVGAGHVVIRHFDETRQRWEKIPVHYIQDDTAYGWVDSFSTYTLTIDNAMLTWWNPELTNTPAVMEMVKYDGTDNQRMSDWMEYKIDVSDPVEDGMWPYERELRSTGGERDDVDQVIRNEIQNVYANGIRKLDLIYSWSEEAAFNMISDTRDDYGMPFSGTSAWDRSTGRNSTEGSACYQDYNPFNDSYNFLQCATFTSIGYSVERVLQIIDDLNASVYQSDPIVIKLTFNGRYGNWEAYESRLIKALEPDGASPPKAKVFSIKDGSVSAAADDDILINENITDITDADFHDFIEKMVSTGISEIENNYPNVAVYSAGLSIDNALESGIGLKTTGLGYLAYFDGSPAITDWDINSRESFEQYVQFMFSRQEALRELYKTFFEAVKNADPSVKTAVYVELWHHYSSLCGIVDYYQLFKDLDIDIIATGTNPRTDEDFLSFYMSYSASASEQVGASFNTELTWAHFDMLNAVVDEEAETDMGFYEENVWCDADALASPTSGVPPSLEELDYRFYLNQQGSGWVDEATYEPSDCTIGAITKDLAFFRQFMAGLKFGASELRFANWDGELFKKHPYWQAADGANHGWNVMGREWMRQISQHSRKEHHRTAVYLPSVGRIDCELVGISATAGGTEDEGTLREGVSCNEMSPIPNDYASKYGYGRIDVITDEMILDGQVQFWRYDEILVPYEYTHLGERAVMEYLYETGSGPWGAMNKIKVEKQSGEFMGFKKWFVSMDRSNRLLDIGREMPSKKLIIARILRDKLFSIGFSL